MSLQRLNPAPSNPSSKPASTSHTRPRRHPNQPPKQTQNTLWGFIRKAMIPAPTPPTPTTQPEPLDTPISQTPLPTPEYTPRSNLEPRTHNHIAHQLPLCPSKKNEAWGDVHRYNNPHDCFRVVSKNVSTLNPQSLDMTAIATELQQINASAFLAQETNTAWKPSTTLAIHAQCHRVQRHFKLATSSSQDSNEGRFQPGGTLALVWGKWASRVIGWGHDELLGRWSYLEFVGQRGMRLIIVSAYRVCPQPFDATTTTSTVQQTRLLLRQGVSNPNPRKQFISDLILQVREWRSQNKEVLIGLDANENTDSPNAHIAKLFDDTDLIDLHQHRFPAQPKPATHQRGSHPIDLLIGSPLLVTALQYAWILPFGEPAMIKGDHRLLGLDFSPTILFGSTTETPSVTLLRGVNSKHDQQVQHFCKRVICQCNQNNLEERTAQLLGKTHLTEIDIAELEAIDQTLTKILLKADRQCRPLSQAPWSPTLRTAYMAHRYWALKLTSKRTERDLSTALTAIASRIDPNLTTQDPTRSLSSHLRQAQKRLKQAKREADQLRKAHLEAILNQALAAKHQKKSNALKYLIRAEHNRRCYVRFRRHTKPKASGGLAFVTFTNDTGEKQTLLERTELEDTLLEYSRTHFAGAEGSKFTQEPLNQLLLYDGLTPFGDCITQGKEIDTLHHFDEPTAAVLKHLKCKAPPPETNSPRLNYSTLIEGIKKWPESMTTSPSGRHLGIYKTLAKHVVEKDDKTTLPPSPAEGLTQGRDVIYLIFNLMSIAIAHTYPLERWRNAWTIFIEKEMGNPDLNRLRCIMLFEADWQLLLKWYSSYGFLPRTEEAGTLATEQGGGRKGRSAIDQATQQVVETELVHLNQRTHIDMYLDLRTCFDLMVEACHNLACRQHGAADEYLQLHAKMHQLMWYFERHKFGVSAAYNTFAQHPMAWCRSRCSQRGTQIHCTL